MKLRLRAFVSLWVVVLVTATVLAQESQPADARLDAIRVLFIGNSYTYYHNLPAMVEAIAEADDALPPIKTRMLAPGGASMADHWEIEEHIAVIQEGGWDYVVLQPQSTFDEVFMVRGQRRVNGYARYHQYASHIIGEIRKIDSIPVLYMQWRRRDASSRDIAIIRKAHGDLARETGSRVAPVGEAFELVRAAHPDIDLYDPDGSHPSAAGSFLAAQVMVRTLTGRAPADAPSRLSGPAIDYEIPRALPDTIVELVSVDATRAAALHDASRRAALQLGGRESANKDGLPQLPVGLAIKPARLEGTWRGTLDVYPSPTPATIEIRLSRVDDEWSLDANISFDGGRPNPITPTVADLEITPTGLRFTDSAGPDGGIVRYQANFTGDAIKGIAEIIIEGEPIYGIGGWTVTKVND